MTDYGGGAWRRSRRVRSRRTRSPKCAGRGTTPNARTTRFVRSRSATPSVTRTTKPGRSGGDGVAVEQPYEVVHGPRVLGDARGHRRGRLAPGLLGERHVWPDEVVVREVECRRVGVVLGLAGE